VSEMKQRLMILTILRTKIRSAWSSRPATSMVMMIDWDYLGPAIPYYEFMDTNALESTQRYSRPVWLWGR